MELLRIKYATVVRLLDTFGLAIEFYREAKADETMEVKLRDVFRDSVIKRFEFSYDLLWKYLREYIGTTQGTYVDAPRKVFDLSFQYGIVNAEEAVVLCDMIKSMYATINACDLGLMIEMSEKVSEYHQLMQDIITRTSPDAIKTV